MGQPDPHILSQVLRRNLEAGGQARVIPRYLARLVGCRAPTVRLYPLPRQRHSSSPAQGYARCRLLLRVHLPLESPRLHSRCAPRLTRRRQAGRAHSTLQEDPQGLGRQQRHRPGRLEALRRGEDGWAPHSSAGRWQKMAGGEGAWIHGSSGEGTGTVPGSSDRGELQVYFD